MPSFAERIPGAFTVWNRKLHYYFGLYLLLFLWLFALSGPTVIAVDQIDTLIAATSLPVSAVQMLLLELDLAGRVEWSSGQLVALKP